MKNCQIGTTLLQVELRTDRQKNWQMNITQLNDASRDYANASKEEIWIRVPTREEFNYVI